MAQTSSLYAEANVLRYQDTRDEARVSKIEQAIEQDGASKEIDLSAWPKNLENELLSSGV